MSDAPTTRSLLPEIASPLARLRLYIRGYICLQALAAVIAALGLAFWATLALDWFFEPPPSIRAAMLIALALGCGWLLLRQWVLRIVVPLGDRSLALLLERRHRQLGDRLLTVVELADRSPTSAGFDPRMLAHTAAAARGLMQGVRPGRVLKLRPLVVTWALAATAAASVALFVVSRPAAFNIWVGRSLLLGDVRWPRDTLIRVDGFPRNAKNRRTTKVATGADLEVHAQADTSKRIPDALEIRYVAQDGTTVHQNMTMQGAAVPGRDPYQNYFFKFKNVQNTIRFDVLARRAGLLGKDDRVDDLWIEAVESPTITNLVLHCKYPAYLHRSNESLPVTGIMAVPDGTELRIEAQSSKDLVRAECQVAAGDRATVRNVEVPDRRRRFELPLGTLRHNAVVLFTLHDTDNVTNRQPARLQIRVVPDEVPELDVRLSGIGRAITPRAILPLRGRISDDRGADGIVRTWFEYRVDNATQSRQRDFKLPSEGQLTKRAGIALDLQNLDLAPGGRLYLWIKAADGCTLDKSPHVGTTPRYELEIVTESQLRSGLEASELLLRRRLETVMTDLTRARDSLERLKSEAGSGAAPLPPPSAPRTSTAAKSASSGQTKGRGAAGAKRVTLGAERTAQDDERALTRGAIRVEEALQGSNHALHETLEVAEQFDQILEELQNNRVEHLELARSRLQDGIADPLKRTVAEEFPRLRTRLEALRAVLADTPQRLAGAASAQQQLDVILRQMEQVMGKMLELESYNELLAQLRNIIQSQENISRMTKERREQLKKELRKGLLE